MMQAMPSSLMTLTASILSSTISFSTSPQNEEKENLARPERCPFLKVAHSPQLDYCNRVIAWFDEHLKKQQDKPVLPQLEMEKAFIR